MQMYTGFFGPLNKYLSQANQTKPTIQPYDFLCFDASVPFSKGIASFASSAVAKTTAAVPFPWAESTKCQQNSLFCCLFVDLDVFPKYIYIYIHHMHTYMNIYDTYIYIFVARYFTTKAEKFDEVIGDQMQSRCCVLINLQARKVHSKTAAGIMMGCIHS